MNTIKGLVSISIMLVAGAAFGQAAPDKKPPPPAAGAAAAPKPPEAPPMPKPAAEMDQLKGMLGSWKCDGKMTMNGQDMSAKGTYKVAAELDNFWLVGRFESAKDKSGHSFKGVDYYTYDAGSKMFIMASVDNMGSWSMSRSKGWEADNMNWEGKTTMMGAPMDMKMSVTRKGDKEVHLTGTTTGQGFTSSMDQTCKK